MELYFGIDVSKGYSDFVALNKAFQNLEPPLQLDDTRQGHDKLKKWLHDTVEKHGISRVNAAVESTGSFEDNWFSTLFNLSGELSIRVARLNPTVVKNAAKADHGTQVTDALSARNIANYLIRYGEQVDYRKPDNKYRSYRSLQNHITLLTRQKSQMINELKQLIYSCFPELQRYCRQSVPTWVLELLVQYPVKEKLCRARPHTVAKIRNVTLEKAKRLVAMAKDSVGARNGQTYAFMIKSMASDILSMQKRLAQLKAHLEENCKGPEVDLVQSVTGVGAYSAASIMIQIEDIDRFASANHLPGYFGLYPTLKESGDKKHVSRMSKKGRPAIRGTLYMCASTAVLHDPHFKGIYHRHRKRGKTHKQAIGVVMHKMLRVIWGILKSRKPYDPGVDKANQEKNKSETKDNERKAVETRRRIQDFESQAPVSRIEAKKRKAHQTSQVSNAERVRDPVDAPSSQT